jgi:hypothetical protein
MPHDGRGPRGSAAVCGAGGESFLRLTVRDIVAAAR